MICSIQQLVFLNAVNNNENDDDSRRGFASHGQALQGGSDLLLQEVSILV